MSEEVARVMDRRTTVFRWLETLEKYDARPCVVLGADREGRVILSSVDGLSPADVRDELLELAAKIDAGKLTHVPD